MLGDPKDKDVQATIRRKRKALKEVPNLYILREELLMKNYPYPEPEVQRDITIGIPRVLSFWETMPFWGTFWKALGFKVKVSPASTRKIYEDGLSAVTSIQCVSLPNLSTDISAVWQSLEWTGSLCPLLQR